MPFQNIQSKILFHWATENSEGLSKSTCFRICSTKLEDNLYIHNIDIICISFWKTYSVENIVAQFIVFMSRNHYHAQIVKTTLEIIT